MDSDFGFAINATADSIITKPKYKNIRTFITAKRFIFISGCEQCPILIDRDSIDYGMLLTKAGKNYQLQENHIYSAEAFLSTIAEYFGNN